MKVCGWPAVHTHNAWCAIVIVNVVKRAYNNIQYAAIVHLHARPLAVYVQMYTIYENRFIYTHAQSQEKHKMFTHQLTPENTQT